MYQTCGKLDPEKQKAFLRGCATQYSDADVDTLEEAIEVLCEKAEAQTDILNEINTNIELSAEANAEAAEELCDKTEAGNDLIATLIADLDADNQLLCDKVEDFIEQSEENAEEACKKLEAMLEQLSEDKKSVIYTKTVTPGLAPEGCKKIYACCNIETKAIDYMFVINADGSKTEVKELGEDENKSIKCETRSITLGVFVEASAGDIPLSDLRAKAVAAFAASGETWGNGDAITLEGTDHGCIYKASVEVAQKGQKACDSSLIVENSDNALKINDEGPYSNGGVHYLGGSSVDSEPSSGSISLGDTITTLEPLVGYRLCIDAARCSYVKTGEPVTKIPVKQPVPVRGN